MRRQSQISLATVDAAIGDDARYCQDSVVQYYLGCVVEEYAHYLVEGDADLHPASIDPTKDLEASKKPSLPDTHT